MRVDETAEGASRARGVMRLIESRNITLLAVALAVLRHQEAALEKGPQSLRPMTMQSVADDWICTNPRSAVWLPGRPSIRRTERGGCAPCSRPTWAPIRGLRR